MCDPCPDFVSDRSRNLCLPYVRADRHKKPFLFSSIKWCNNLPLEIRTSSLGIFKLLSTAGLLKYLQFLKLTRNYLFILGSVARQYLTLACDLILVPWNTTFFSKIVVYHQPVLFKMHWLKILNTIFCTAPVLLLSGEKYSNGVKNRTSTLLEHCVK